MPLKLLDPVAHPAPVDLKLGLTRAAPPNAGVIMGRTTFRKVNHLPAPRFCEASSTDESSSEKKADEITTSIKTPINKARSAKNASQDRMKDVDGMAKE